MVFIIVYIMNQEKIKKASLFGKIVRMIIKRVIKNMLKGVSEDDPAYAMTVMGIEEGALESLLSITNGAFTPKLADMLILFGNRKYGKGIIRAFRK